MINNIIRNILLLVFALFTLPMTAQNLSTKERQEISKALTRIIDREVMGGSTKIQRVDLRGRRLRLYCSIGLANYPFREANVAALYDTVRNYLPISLRNHHLEIYTDGQRIESLIPLAERSTKARKGIIPFTHSVERPLITPLSALHTPTQGLRGRHIALWQSHGSYFDQGNNAWQWQRTAHWMTREDLFTQSFVLPYLLPMLEQAGATVLLPRERDLSDVEWIIDNDQSHYTSGYYEEYVGTEAWYTLPEGFAHLRLTYEGTENPFHAGTFRAVRTIRKGKESRAVWRVEIPTRGRHTLYVSYRTLPESTSDARYTVQHAGGESCFSVNQQMGGGTWIPLGEFDFEKGMAIVTLTNCSNKAGEILTADAVKIGGEYGNIARIPCDSLRIKAIDYRAQVSGLTRAMEGARYWLQWAGFSPEVYAPCRGTDDYKEDYMSRAHWVNALMGGSERLPDQPGLGIPIDLALAFHSDSGVRDGDETIGTLGIFYTKEGNGLFQGGASRYLSRDLTDLVMSEIVGDIRAQWEPSWRRRGLWNRSYYEARVPAAPTMLLELLSHQNLADMRYGHDPRFKFLVSRAIYKGILKHLSAQYDLPYVVQPLPISGFALQFEEENELHLQWHPTPDPLEPSAMPNAYLLYTARDEGPFDEGQLVTKCDHRLRLEPGHHYHFRVVALNEGGRSFPSETLSAYMAPEEVGRVLIINGFTRVSAPPSFRAESETGFCLDYDSGVADGRDIAYIGAQRIFDRARLQESNPKEALGACGTEWEGEIIGGNTFDYPALHGRSIARAGYSYTSVSLAAVCSREVSTAGISLLDVILGKQRATPIGSGYSGYEFEVFPEELQRFIRQFTAERGSLFLSGCYLASDLWESDNATDRDRQFAREVLHYEYRQSAAATDGRVRSNSAELLLGSGHFVQHPHASGYAVDSPDALLPSGEGAFVCAYYPETGLAAGVAYAGPNYRTLLFGFPFERLDSATDRDRMMSRILQFLHP